MDTKNKKNAAYFFGGILPKKLQANLNLRTVKLDSTSYTEKGVAHVEKFAGC